MSSPVLLPNIQDGFYRLLNRRLNLYSVKTFVIKSNVNYTLHNYKSVNEKKINRTITFSFVNKHTRIKIAVVFRL